jgi:hypothetical protein
MYATHAAIESQWHAAASVLACFCFSHHCYSSECVFSISQKENLEIRLLVMKWKGKKFCRRHI